MGKEADGLSIYCSNAIATYYRIFCFSFYFKIFFFHSKSYYTSQEPYIFVVLFNSLPKENLSVNHFTNLLYKSITLNSIANFFLVINIFSSSDPILNMNSLIICYQLSE